MADATSLTQQINNEHIVLNSNKEQCSKKAKTASIDEKDDKISKLPHDILCQILSSFPTKETVRTSVLSKQWRYIWTLVPNLDFDDQLFVRNKERRQDIEIANCFSAFVTRVLRLHCVSSIQKLRLSCCRNYGFSCVSDWINAAITRDIEDMDLSLCDYSQVLPQKFFSNNKLVVLRLHRVALTLPAASIHFPSLKTLFLDSVKFTDETDMKILLSRCPILGKLDIMRDVDVNDNVFTLHISSTSLKSLRVITIYYGGFEEIKIVIEAPNLQSLDLVDRVTEDFRVTRSPFLEKVNLDLAQYDSYVEESVYGDRLCNLLKSLSNMKDLFITSVFFEYFKFDDLPIFHNLKSLKLEILCNETSEDILIQLLEHSPNLQTLYIESYMLCPGWHRPDDVAILWDAPSWVLECVDSSLEVFKFTRFVGNDSEMEMIAYFLKNAMVLKKMVIEPQVLLDSDTKSKLLMFPRSSNTCEVIISSSSS